MILITGASSGIGESCARAFAAQKRPLFLVARRLDRLKRLAAEFKRKYKVKVEIAQLDVSSSKAVSAFSKKYAKLLKQVDVLINSAGLAKGFETIQEGKTKDWDQVIDTNLKGLLYVTHAVLPAMIAAGRGHIINLGSVAGFYTYPKGAIYCASKYAVRSLSEALRADLLGKGIRVTEISPGMVETEFSEVRLGNKDRAKSVYAGMKPLTPADIADIAVWSVSRPAHVNIAEVIVYPTDQASPTLVSRKS